MVRRQLDKFRTVADISHEIILGLGHDTDYDKREIAHAATFIASCLGLASGKTFDVAALAESLLDDDRLGCDKDWAALSEAQKTWAKQLGIKAICACACLL